MATQRQISAAIKKALEPFKGEKYEAERVVCERKAFIRKFEIKADPRRRSHSQAFITIVIDSFDGADCEIELPITNAEADALASSTKAGTPPMCRLVLVEEVDDDGD